MKYLVTGGLGFIGTNLVERLLKDGEEVVVYDNMSRDGCKDNLDYLIGSWGFTLVQTDIRNFEALSEEMEDTDVVIHLAAQVAVTTSVEDPREDFEINALGTFNVCEAMRQHAPDATLIYASTNKVYGGMEDLEVTEGDGRYEYADLPDGVSEDRGLDFHSPYGCSKGAGDQYVRDYARIYGLKTVVLRQSCIYGQRQFGVEDQGWVAWFCIASTLDKPITVFGDGKQIRDILHVDDLVELYLKVVYNIDEVAGGVYNIGGGPENTLSLLELLDMLDNTEYEVDDWRPGDQRVFVSDISKAKTDLDWTPKIDTKNGVKSLIKWVKENKDLFI